MRKKDIILSEEVRNREKALSRIRQARYRENRKQKLEQPDNIQAKQPPKKALTHAEHQRKKTYWKEKKRLQRENMTAQKKRRIREKDRLCYAQRKLSKKNIGASTCTTLPSTPQQSSSLLSASAKKQRAYRLKMEMPKSPEKFAQVIGHIVMNATPRKKASLKKVGILNSPMKGKKRLECYTNAIKETMIALKEKRQDRWRAVKRCLVMSLKSTKKARNFKQMSLETGINYKFFRQYGNLSEIKDLEQLQRNKRQDCFDGEIIAKVQDHFVSSSSFVPDKKAVSKKTMESKKVLDEPVSKVYEKFKEKKSRY